MGCAASSAASTEPTDVRRRCYTRRPATDANLAAAAVAEFEAVSVTDTSAGASIAPSLQSHYDEAECLCAFAAQSVGRRTPEPSELSRSVTETVKVVRAYVLHGVDGDPDQYLHVVQRRQEREIEENLPPRTVQHISQWLQNVVRAPLDDSALLCNDAATCDFSTSTLLGCGGSQLSVASLRVSTVGSPAMQSPLRKPSLDPATGEFLTTTLAPDLSPTMMIHDDALPSQHAFESTDQDGFSPNDSLADDLLVPHPHAVPAA